MNTTWLRDAIPASGVRAPRAENVVTRGRKKLSVKWGCARNRPMPARKLPPRGRRGCGGHESVVPAIRAGLLRSRATMPWDMPRLGYTATHDPAGWPRHRRGYWVCPGICPATRHASCYDARR